MVLSSPSELISWTELSRPTVNGNTACGNKTVSRTGNTGSERLSGDILSLYIFVANSTLLRSLRPAPGVPKPNLSVWYSSFDAQTRTGIHLSRKWDSRQHLDSKPGCRVEGKRMSLKTSRRYENVRAAPHYTRVDLG